MSLRAALKGLWRRAFEAGQRVGVDVLPRHYYSEIPDIAALRRDRGWRRAYRMTGVAGADLPSQAAFVRECCEALPAGARGRDAYERACRENGQPGYGRVEAQLLYCFMRRFRPRRVIQVGCGLSTAVMLQAAADGGFSAELRCVEPYPNAYLRGLAAAGTIRLVEEKAQALPSESLAELPPGSLLFVDSTHTLAPGGEVPRLVLETLPLLAPGVFVHFHDVYFPYDYSRGILGGDLFFPHESVLLHAFLAMNGRFAVRASLSMLHYGDPEALRRWLDYRPAGNEDGIAAGEGDFPSSLYLEAKP
jgi:hypothetical protein